MTATIPHRLIFNNETFSIIGVDGEGLFNPTDYKIKVIPTTACAGFNCTYRSIDNCLQLNEVYLNLDIKDKKLIERESSIELFGIVPSRYIEKNAKGKEFISSDFKCDNINKLTQFVGGILVGCNSVSGFFTARGLPSPYTFHKVYELIFDSGQLVEMIDCSRKMSQFRNMLINKELQFNNSEKWLEQCFSFYYDR